VETTIAIILKVPLVNNGVRLLALADVEPFLLTVSVCGQYAKPGHQPSH